MKNYGLVGAAVVVVSAMAFNATAQDAELAQKRELAGKIIKASMQALDQKKILTASLDSAVLSIVSNVKRANLNQSVEYFDKVANVARQEIEPLTKQALDEFFPPLLLSLENTYAQEFSLPELTELLKTHENPLFQRSTSLALNNLPKLMEPMMQSMQQRSQSVDSRVREALKKEGLLPPPKP